MVATIGAIGNSAAASSYYEADDYYADGDISPSEWQDEGAKTLGLSGEVNRETFRAILDGTLPHGQQLGTMREGKLQHRPGWDATMSADMWVSIFGRRGEHVAYLVIDAVCGLPWARKFLTVVLQTICLSSHRPPQTKFCISPIRIVQRVCS